MLHSVANTLAMATDLLMNDAVINQIKPKHSLEFFYFEIVSVVYYGYILKAPNLICCGVCVYRKCEVCDDHVYSTSKRVGLDK
jgi:hypothetical protein